MKVLTFTETADFLCLNWRNGIFLNRRSTRTFPDILTMIQVLLAIEPTNVTIGAVAGPQVLLPCCHCGRQSETLVVNVRLFVASLVTVHCYLIDRLLARFGQGGCNLSLKLSQGP